MHVSRSRAAHLAAVAASAGALVASILTPLSASAAPSATGLAARNAAVCPTPQNGDAARCHAIRHDVVDRNGKPGQPQATTPSGYGPSDLQAAYGLNTLSAGTGSGRTVAIVDAYDAPSVASDLAAYRGHYGLPPTSTCQVTSTSVQSPDSRPCFAKVNQSGAQGSYPRANGGWAQEISLDVDMVSAACPSCNILLVEASSASFSNLGKAVQTAAKLGAVAISNSYGSTGDLSDSTYGTYYDHPGIAVTASTGDNGYGVGYPATSQYTIAVGGTSLAKDSSARGWTEEAWSGAGSGCSTYQARPGWQTTTACGSNRAIADVSSDADPNTGVAVYDTYSYQGYSGWMTFGGTSASSPFIAAVYALAGSTGAVSSTDGVGNNPARFLYAASSGLNDVTSGSNGNCSVAVLCTAGTTTSSWDGPTGLGTPNGLAAFGPPLPAGGTGGGGSGGGTTGTITLSAAKTGRSQVTLTWTGCDSGCTVLRDGTSLATGVASPYVDNVVSRGWHTYQVTSGAAASNIVRVKI